MTHRDETESEPTLLFERQGGVATLTINRPQARNALTTGLFLELERMLLEIEADDTVRVVVLTGSGRAFSTGADLKALAEPRPERDDTAQTGDGTRFDRLLDTLADFPKPLLMAVNGYAVGFGMTMLAFADVVCMSTEARLRCPSTELGAPTEAGSSYLFPQLLGRQQAVLVGAPGFEGALSFIGFGCGVDVPDQLQMDPDDFEDLEERVLDEEDS